MSAPDGWTKQSERLTWSTEAGWEASEEWHGPSGPAKATRTAWLADYPAYTSLELRDDLPIEDGDAVCTAVIKFASSQSGLQQDPESPEYGLLSRTWTLVGSDEQLPIEAHPHVQAMQTALEEWPLLVRQYVSGFQKRVKDAIEGWGFTSGAPTLPIWQLPNPTGDAVLGGYAERYASLLLLGDHPTFDSSRYVLKKTETVTSWSTLVVAHENVNRWHGYGALNTAEPTLAGTGLIELSGITDLIWIKRTPESVRATAGNYELSQEYWGGILPPAGSKAEENLIFIFGAVL